MISFTVYGLAQPAGSKTARPIWEGRPDGSRVPKRRPDGSIMTVVTDANKKSAGWKQEVKAAAVKAMAGRPLLHGPLKLVVEFTIPRSQSHYGTGKNAGKLKPNAPIYHTVKPDVTKLVRGIEDAMTGVVWRDDAQVAVTSQRKVYGETACVTVEVEELEAGPVAAAEVGAQDDAGGLF